MKCTYDCYPESILEYHFKGLKLPRWGIFGLPLTQSVKILQKKISRAHHASYITQHILHMNFKFYKKLNKMMVVLFDNL